MEVTLIIGDDHAVEKLCEHGVGHPLRKYRPEGAHKYWGIHTCDGCCGKEDWDEDSTTEERP